MFRSKRTLPRNLQPYTGQASTEELHTDLNNMRYTELYSIQQWSCSYEMRPPGAEERTP
ncbi:TPA: hypothetical protein ACIH8C_003741 [Salmonella enterica subsp. enterica serovar Typhimurium]